MRLIDKEKLLDAVQGAIDVMEAHGISMIASSVPLAIIKGAPTVDAIPVEWLRRVKDSLPSSVEKMGIDAVLILWQNEQEARTCD